MKDRYEEHVTIEIRYCVVWGYLPVAVWMATEIWHEFGSQAPVTIVPVDEGRLEVTANGETLFDRKAEGGIYPEVKRMRQLQEEIKQRVDAAE